MGEPSARESEFIPDDDLGNTLSKEDAQAIAKAMIWSSKLEEIPRSFGMTHWEEETKEEQAAAALRTGPRLESVADHTWHLCDTLLLVAPYFSGVDTNRALQMALLHDKLEIIAGDQSPMGKSGTGRDGVAYNEEAIKKKDAQERLALEKYLDMLPSAVSELQADTFNDFLNGNSPESMLVTAIDKIQIHVWHIRKKAGKMTNPHLEFSIKYVRLKTKALPTLEPLVFELEEQQLDLVARERGVPRTLLDSDLNLEALRC